MSRKKDYSALQVSVPDALIRAIQVLEKRTGDSRSRTVTRCLTAFLERRSFDDEYNTPIEAPEVEKEEVAS